MELFLDDSRGVSDEPSVTHEFTTAMISVVAIVIFSVVLVSCINRKYRRDFEYDYEKAE